MEDKLNVDQHHRLVLLDREQMEIAGVMGVISFDDHQIILETNRGVLKIIGTDLHIKHLDLEAAKMEVEGTITTLEYSADRGIQGKGLLGRLFR